MLYISKQLKYPRKCRNLIEIIAIYAKYFLSRSLIVLCSLIGTKYILEIISCAILQKEIELKSNNIKKIDLKATLRLKNITKYISYMQNVQSEYFISYE